VPRVSIQIRLFCCPALGVVFFGDNMDYKVKNWGDFQHYKDRNPPWIKLHKTLLDDMDYFGLSVANRGRLILLWLLASENFGLLPSETACMWRLRDHELKIKPFIDAGFILNHDGGEVKKCDWSSRYIKKADRERLLRSQSQCQECGAIENLEIDHVIPVSRGGTSDYDNLQVLCRACNRRKRTKIPNLRSKVGQPLQMYAPETETETEVEVEVEKEREPEGELAPLKISHEFEQEIFRITGGMVIGQIIELIKDFGGEQDVLEAYRAAEATKGKEKFKPAYVRSILQRWHVDGKPESSTGSISSKPSDDYVEPKRNQVSDPIFQELLRIKGRI